MVVAETAVARVEKRADFLFELSWEICNKVGGIYTVITSKAAQATSRYEESYLCIGPYFHDKVLGEFEELPLPEQFKPICEELQQLGIIAHYGNWLIKGEPKALLLDFSGFFSQTNDIKRRLWESYKIDSLYAGRDFDEPVTWAWAAGLVLEKLALLYQGKSIVAQFHEWLSGAALLYIKEKKLPIATIFTTHATVLGRAIASVTDLYTIIDKIEPEKEAYGYGVQFKHQLERAAALNADIFTTVSEITALETERFLGRKPEFLLPNGLDIETFPSFEEVSIKHKELKFRFKEFILYYFFPYYSFDLDETLIFFTFARYEFHNKGIDVFIRALARLNDRLKEEKIARTIVAFLFIPAGIKGIKAALIENRNFYDDIKELVDNAAPDIRNRVLVALLSGAKLTKEEIFMPEFLAESKRRILRFVKGGKPLLCTHNLSDEAGDPIMAELASLGLANSEEDKVKIVFYPTYLTGADGLLDLNLHEAILGGHLGVFPSIYEPWGYTPLEAGALGVANITTDLAGFGQYVLRHRPREICEAVHCVPARELGIFVARRKGKSDEEFVEELTNIMYFYAKLNKEERINNKIEARRLAGLADWKILFDHYVEAHNAALAKIAKAED